jgi:DNA-binding NarL/FixJ family response regulator
VIVLRTTDRPTEGNPPEMRVLIIVDNALTAEAIRHEMRHAPSCRVLGYVNGRGSCAKTIADADPGLVIVDDMSDEQATLSRIREVRNAVPQTKIVLLTVRMEPQWLAEASAAGIDSAIAKSAAPATVGLLIREVAAGNVFHTFAPSSVAVGIDSSSIPDLTAREFEILRWVAAGASNSTIARELYVTEQTVKFHLSNIYRKLDVANRTEASRWAQVHGLLRTVTDAGTAAA